MNARTSLLAALGGLSLAACVVLPVDPRTGLPYPVEPASRGGATTTVVVPAAPAAPPQPSLLSARLYPLNQQANQGGLVTATIVDTHAGRGTITLAYRGDTLQGEATRVDASFAGFGRLHDEVLGTGARRWGSGQRGIANAWGPRGVNAQCEYQVTGPAQGTGVCLFSDGAKYQIHFGG